MFVHADGFVSGFGFGFLRSYHGRFTSSCGAAFVERVYSLRDKCSSFSTGGSRPDLDGFVSKIASRKALQGLVRVTRYEVYP